jgi:hypothetical protein
MHHEVALVLLRWMLFRNKWFQAAFEAAQIFSLRQRGKELCPFALHRPVEHGDPIFSDCQFCGQERLITKT